MKQGTILHVCVSERKGTVKDAVQRAVLRENHGVEGDAHAGPWHRQVSLLGRSDIDTIRAKGLELAPGAFGENLVVDGLDLDTLGIGTRLRISVAAGAPPADRDNEAELEITQIGKVCHNRCAIYDRTGDCIMPRAGVFARVSEGGEVKPGMALEVTAEVPRDVIQAAVVTVSDRCAAGSMEDTAGPAVTGELKRTLEAHICRTEILPDDLETIATTLREIADRNVDLVVTVGGTGCGPRDVTPEATRAVIARDVPGLAEAMRSASARITPHALLQRGICGICGVTLVVNLPGSRKAATENLQVVLPALEHAVRLLRGESVHPQSA